MEKFRKLTAVCLALVLCAGLMCSCGKDENKTAVEEPVEVALSSDVNIAVMDGDGYASVSELPKDYRVEKVDDQDKLIDTIKEGKYDFAIVDPVVAAEIYSEEKGFKAVMPVYLSDWSVAVLGDPGDKKPKVSQIASRIIYIPEDDAASADILKAIVRENGRTLYSSQLRIINNDTFEMAAASEFSVIMANDKKVDQVISKNDKLKVWFDIGELWQESFGSSIPGEILIVNEDFLKNRGDEVATVLNDMAENMEKAQKATDKKLVVYNMSNRGIAIIKDFNKAMELDLPQEYYWSE